ncbi:MAG: RNA polymerase sigma-70 factor, partial [Bacteroidota bacterium]
HIDPILGHCFHLFSMSDTSTDRQLLAAIGEGDQEAFDTLFRQYYKYLITVAYGYVKDLELSKDLAQEVFLSLWKRKAKIQISYSVKAFLRGAIINQCKTALRNQTLTDDLSNTEIAVASEENAQRSLELGELHQSIEAIIASMPERCRAVFLLSRRENLSHREIAEKLNIANKTIENQMTKALKMLRKGLKEQNLISLLLLIFGLK